MKQTILLVEDQAIIAVDTAESIRNFGYAVAIAHSGEGAIDAVKNNSDIGLILMDIDLGPGMNGIDTAERILAIRHLPIVFVTSHCESEMIEKVRGITRYGYVLKESDDFVLRSSIEMAYELFHTNRQLRDNSERLKEIFENSLDAAYKRNLASNAYEYLSPAFARIIGYDLDELLEMTLDDIVSLMDPDDIAGVKRMIEYAMSGDSSGRLRVEYRIKHKDGRYRWLEDQFIVAKNDNGEHAALIGSVRDITELKLAEMIIQSDRDLGVKLSGAKTLEAVVRCCLSTAMSVIHMEAGGVYLVDDKGDLNLFIHEGFSEDFVEKVSFFRKNSPSGLLFAQGKPIFVESTTAIHEVATHVGGGEMKMLAQREGLTFICMIPIKIDNQLSASLNIASRRIATISKNTCMFLESLALRLGSEISRVGASEVKRAAGKQTTSA